MFGSKTPIVSIGERSGEFAGQNFNLFKLTKFLMDSSLIWHGTLSC